MYWRVLHINFQFTYDIFNLLFYSIIFVFLEDTSDEEIHFVVGARRETTPMTASPSSSASRPRQRNQVLPDSANKYDIYIFILTCLY